MLQCNSDQQPDIKIHILGTKLVVENSKVSYVQSLP